MNLLSVKNLSRNGREEPLFTNASFTLDEGEKAALIGKNGSGKSTLLACIAGNLDPGEGDIMFAKDAGVSFLPQNPVYNPAHTIREHIFKSESAKLGAIRNYEDICEQMAGRSEADITAGLRDKLDRATEEMTKRNLWDYETHIKQILTTLGITGMEQTMGTLSGGMVKKVALAQVLIDDTKILLLDEPTNHLDITTIAWLEDHLRLTDRGVLMVTHDRYFLDNVCSSIYELDRARIKSYAGNYSIYLEKKAVEAEIEQNTERRIESVLRTEREWLLRGPQARGTKAKARVDAVHRMINRDKIKEDKDFAFEVSGRRLGGKILELEHISKSWEPGKPVIEDFSYSFKKGERLGIFGANGSGKTTLLNILTNTIPPDSGTVKAGQNTVFGYYRQNIDMELSAPGTEAPTVLEYIEETAEVITMNNGKTLTAARMLEQFGFEGKIQYSPVTALSGGERKRLYLVRLLMANPNFLVLDEPTNDFDIFTMSILESFLESYAGCLVIVSHDRCFMDKTADMLLILDNAGGVSGFAGSCTEYLEARKTFAAEPKPGQQPASPKDAPQKTSAEPQQSNKKQKRTFKEQKEFEALENEITASENRRKELEALLSGGETDYSKIGGLGAEYASLGTALETQYARWEELAELENY
ncbi:ABC-F family ATP-binding cassette domain-containing protein [Breznakiella homolactica]|uniref:ABC-F family ATP-binding cassette domain-containing protein n=1 Tax=Breznakiella homolactica TaxID=2798577 RepID=A0A7T7XLN8_9SPIR|nr:ABC-F family ATP-binding cassette domain-containing protein [Breznakiella homolactica]QQO08699.1 ABC-F family ATP-binding cassette domain-containing protein [Breznakiella homolactica]